MNPIIKALLSLVVITLVTSIPIFQFRKHFAKKSPRDRFVGWVMCYTTVGSCFAWGLAEIILGGVGGLYQHSYALVGLLFGLVTGAIAGNFFWYFYARYKQQPKESFDSDYDNEVEQ